MCGRSAQEDRAALADFFEGLTPESRGLRFFSAAANVTEEAERAVDVDYADRYGLIATRGEDSQPVGHSGYARISEGRAEVAFAVADALQGHGLGTILLAHLAEIADEQGITTFEAEVLPENHRMIEVFRESGFPVEVRSVPGSIQVELPTSFSSEALERFADRDRSAAAAAARSLHRAPVGGRHRCVPGTGHGRGPDLPQPARRRFPGRRLPCEPGGRGGPVRAGLRQRRRDSWTRSTSR